MGAVSWLQTRNVIAVFAIKFLLQDFDDDVW
jgi:hypothetical protein